MDFNLLDNSSSDVLSYLDWGSITGEIIDLCHFERSQQNLRIPPQSLYPSEIESNYNSIEYFIRKINMNDDGALKDSLSSIEPGPALTVLPQRLTKGSVLTLQELNYICVLCETFGNLTKQLKDWNLYQADTFSPESLKALSRNFIGPLRRVISRNGDIDYGGDPRLHELFLKAKELESRIRQTLAVLIKTPEFTKALQYTEYDLINDRFVLAIKSDSYSAVHGLIVSRSESGMTLFVEPKSIRSMCNQRIEKLAEIDEIIVRLCMEFCQSIAGHASLFSRMHAMCVLLDTQLAKAQYCHRHGLHRPELTNDPKINLHDFFHPLIKNAVKNELQVPSDKKGIIISGPNTGGKTATLKSVALCHLFVHAGLFVPAIDSQIYPFTGIYYFSHDQQDLTHGLSSFSSESKNYMHLLQTLGPSNLIIIDEIFNSTSSDEASVLALALFKEIHKISKSKLLVSTHHQLLKTLIHQNEDYISAHVGFDIEEQKPNYKLYCGIPGSSMAIRIFRQLSLGLHFSEPLTTEAQELLDQKQVTYESLLQSVSSKEVELYKLLESNKKINTELINEKHKQEGLLKLKKEEEFRDFSQNLKFAFQEAEALLQNLKNKSAEISKNQVYNQMSAIKGLVEEIYPSEERSRSSKDFANITSSAVSNTKTPKEIKEGDRFFHTGIRKHVIVKAIDHRKNEVLVGQGALTLRCKKEDLVVDPNGPKQKVTITIDRDTQPEVTLDARGMRLDDFKMDVENSLGDLRRGELPFIEVIHGHGEGILKTWLRKYLKEQEDLDWVIPEQSQDGSTRVKLK